MKQFEENVKKCEEIIKAVAGLEPGNYLKKDGENKYLIIKYENSCAIGLMDGSEWIHCYEFENNEFIRYEPMTYNDMDWALSKVKNL